MILLAAMVGAYFFGSMPTAVLVARRVAGVNILEVGSGNPGASNIFRVLGPRWAITTFAVDVFKGYMPVWLVSKFAHDLIVPGFAPNATVVMAWVGLAAFLGHVRSPFLHFRGGKGASTGLGAMFAMAPQATTLAILVYAAALFATRTFSLATLTAAVSYPVLLYLREGNGDWHVMAWGLAIPLLLTVTHRRNIARIFSGKELRMLSHEDDAAEDDHEGVK